MERLALWAALALLALVGIVAALVTERRRFAARAKSGSWAWVRLATLPILALAVAAVFLPARAVRGPEALAVFYVLMVTAAPLLWFALHALAGALVRPRLTRAESMHIALSGLLMLLLPALAASMAAPWVHVVSLSMARSGVEAASDAPWPLAVADRGRFAIDGIGELWTERWQAPPGIEVARVELRVRDDYVQIDSEASIYLCRSGRDLHLFWHAAVSPPRWRVYWQDEAGQRRKSDAIGSAPPGPAMPVAIEWLPDGFALPLRLPTAIVSLGYVGADGRETGEGTRSPLQAGKVDTCLPAEFRRPLTARQPPIAKVHLRFWRLDTQQDLRATFVRR